MKTVQDYLDLGLAFVDGDKGYKHIIESFAWRNNDGVKPEYKGLIHAMFENGVIIQDFAKSLNWGGSFNPVIQWRPTVLKSGDAKKEMQEKFLSALYSDSLASKNVWSAIREQFCLPIGIDSPELREAFKSLKDHLERKPKFMIKEEAPSRVRIVNIDGREYLIPSRKPTVSPKEDKPMKPVYTAEMHAKNELPPVGSEFMYSCGGDFQRVIMLFNDGITLLVCLADSKANRWHWKCEDKDLVFKPVIKTIKVNGFDVPAPMSEAPMIGDEYYTPQTGYEVFYCKNSWRCDKFDSRFLSRGLIHSTESAAVAHAKAMLGIDPNA